MPTLASEIIVSTPPDLMSCQQTPFQRTTLRLTMLLLGFPRDGMVVDRLLEALARDAVVGLSAPPTKSERFILRSSERTARDARRLGVCFSSFRRASPSEMRKVAQYECQCGQRRLQLVRNVVMCPLMAWFKYVSRTRRGYAFEFKSVDGSGHVAVIYRAWRSFQAANHPQNGLVMAISRLGMDSWSWSSPWVGPWQTDSPSACFWGGWWE